MDNMVEKVTDEFMKGVEEDVNRAAARSAREKDEAVLDAIEETEERIKREISEEDRPIRPIRKYEERIRAASAEDRKVARQRVHEILRHAQIGLRSSDGDAANDCVDAVFAAFFEDGADGMAKALGMLEK